MFSISGQNNSSWCSILYYFQGLAGVDDSEYEYDSLNYISTTTIMFCAKAKIR
jgi:hypothetical protein